MLLNMPTNQQPSNQRALPQTTEQVLTLLANSVNEFTLTGSRAFGYRLRIGNTPESLLLQDYDFYTQFNASIFDELRRLGATELIAADYMSSYSRSLLDTQGVLTVFRILAVPNSIDIQIVSRDWWQSKCRVERAMLRLTRLMEFTKSQRRLMYHFLWTLERDRPDVQGRVNARLQDRR